jgi:hypothetical protein
MGEARRRKQLMAYPDVLGRSKTLTDEAKTGACLMYLFAVLNWTPGPDDDDDEERWTTYCMNRYARHPAPNSFEACVWWAMRHENNPSLRDSDWLGYLTHVCRNHGLLSR